MTRTRGRQEVGRLPCVQWGGSWYSPPGLLSIANQNRRYPWSGSKDDITGTRLVLEVK